MPNRQHFTGYILAGGKSSRMKRDKAFLEIGGKTFLQNAFDALVPNCEQVKIVLNSNQKYFIEKLPADAGFIFDIFANRGAVGGIHAALKNCETEFTVILAVDLPNVNKPAIEKICKVALNSKEFSAIVPRQNDGGLQPLCAIYRQVHCLAKLEEILAKDIQISARDFLTRVETKIIDAEILSANKNLFANINSPTDFEKIISNDR